MSVGTFMKNSGWTAIAMAMVATALPQSAFAQDRGNRPERSAQQSRTGERPQVAPRNGVEQRQRMAQRAAQRQQERREVRTPEQRGPQGGERPAPPQVQRPVPPQAQQGARPSGPPPRQVESRPQRPGNPQQARPNTSRPGDPRNPQNGWRGEQRAERPAVPPGQPGGQVRPDDRNRSYADRDRNRSYADRDRRDNNWRNGPGWRNDNRGDHRQWDRRWRDNNRYDWHRYRNANRTVFHVGVYYAPYRNYSYRRLSVGYRLDNLFFGSRYWINDPWQYRLPEAYGPYRWVRYYDDALLVDIYSGEVIDVIHNFFW